MDNAALALAGCELLNKNNARISPQSIQQGLMKAHWPGRLEIVSTDPYILLDGAHNLMAARNLARFLSTNLAGRHIILVIGILDDKPYKEMLKSLVPVCHRVILTRAKINRALEPNKLYAVVKDFSPHATVTSDVIQAIKLALEKIRPKDAICIAGSLYVVGEAKEAIDKGLLKRFTKPKQAISFSA
jgi:dihydrofolate synthase/folylpolyglutamate synthase